MLFSYQLLSRLVDLSGLSPEEVRDRLTFSGFEVEGMEPMAQASKLVIGEVLDERPHPNSDHLHLLKVDCAQEGVLSIVCGAPNARKGIKVIVALVGCELPALGETIKKGTIRGEESNGMCCSLVELGVDKTMLDEKQVAGIEELAPDAPVGERNVLGYLGLDDVVLDINVLPNRPDCLSYLGMARELSALFGRKLVKFKHPDLSHVDKKVSSSSRTPACPRFDLLSLTGVVGQQETPLPIRRYLQASGIRPVSPLVDLGNFSMLLTGQPLNLYDGAQCRSGGYVVRDDYEGTFTAFDGRKHELKKGDLAIFDGDDIVCLAGIEAGKQAMVREGTASLDIEFACFYHKNIRHTSSRLGLSSFSSQLFGKGRNPDLIDESVAVTIDLLPYFLKSYEIHSYSRFDVLEKKDRSFPFSLERLNHRLGSAYTQEDVDLVLSRYRIERHGDSLLPPVDRTDLKEQCDIDEEVFRFFGAERIKPSLAGFPVTYGRLDEKQKKVREIEDLLKGMGYLEAMTYTLVSKNQDEDLRVFDREPSYRILNPMTKDHEYVRSDLLSSLLLCLGRNQSRQQNDLALFEISPIDTPKGNRLYLGLLQAGNRYVADNYRPEPYSFLTMKGTVESLFALLGMREGRYRLVPSKNAAFNPMASADVLFGKTLVGTFGTLSPKVDRSEPILAELDLGFLLSQAPGRFHLEDSPEALPVKRDLSFRLEPDSKVDYQSLRKCILKAKDSHIVDVSLFDLFHDVKENCDFLGVSLTIAADKTLTEKEIAASVESAVNEVKKAFGLSLRGEKNA